MNNRILALAIGLGLILTGIVPVIMPHFVLARGCTDARGNPIECPSQPEDPEKKKKTPTPVRITKTPAAALTSTPQAISPTPTLVAALPILPKADLPSAQEPDSPISGWPFSFGSTTHEMENDGDPMHSFPGGYRGFLGLLGLIALTFILIRAARINYEKFEDDTHFFFRKRKPKGGFMPLDSEIELPDTDESGKDSSLIKISFPDGDSVDGDGLLEMDPGDQQEVNGAGNIFDPGSNAWDKKPEEPKIPGEDAPNGGGQPDYKVPYSLNAPLHDQGESAAVEPPHYTARHDKDDDA